MLRWFLDVTRIAQLAVGNQIGLPTAYRYLHEGIDVLAARAADHSHVQLDGTLVPIDRSTAAGPTTVNGRTVDLWWSGKHHQHGGNLHHRTGRLAAGSCRCAPAASTT